MKLCGLALTVLLVCPVLAFAQHEQHGAGAEKLGTVNFETSCKAETRADFNRAVALLHSFEFRPAAETFTKVLAADPSCAIAHWGLAMCQWGNPFGGIKTGPLLERGRDAAAKGLATGSPTPRERAYIAAVSELYKDAATVPHRNRTLAYAKAMEAVQRDNPKDIEAKIFYALAVNQTALTTDKTYAAQLQAAQILEPLWKQYPDHPGLPHYIIHAYDHPPLAPKALEAARKYATIAPSAPHALHMPSHTFTRVGYWKDSVDDQHQVGADRPRAERDWRSAPRDGLPDLRVLADGAGSEGEGRPRPSRRRRWPSSIRTRWAARRRRSPASTRATPLPRGTHSSAACGRRPRRCSRIASSFPQVDAITHYARALGLARSGKPADAKADVDKLAALRDALGARTRTGPNRSTSSARSSRHGSPSPKAGKTKAWA